MAKRPVVGPWYAATPERRLEVDEYLAREQPGMGSSLQNDVLVVQGVYRTPGMDAAAPGFFIKLVFPPEYPADAPVVLETGGRVPRTAERHINPDGTCCLGVPEEWEYRRPDLSFASFMEGPLKNYFVGQALVELGQAWPYGERPHGSAGVLQAFAEILGVSDRDTMVRYLNTLSRGPAKGHWACPCGSNSPLRRCHLQDIQRLHGSITPALARKMLKELDLGT